MHALVLSGRASWDEVDAALVEHEAELARAVAERPVQTNEVQRCWVLLPCFLELARRSGLDELELVELGPSGGLNLMWDRYRYLYAGGSWGDAAAPLELRGEEHASVPLELFELRPRVLRRIGIDVAPVDVTTDEGGLLLRSFVWADQQHRLELLDQAIETLRADPPELIEGDILDELPRVLAGRSTDRLTIVWQTAVLGYVSEEYRSHVYEQLEEAAQAGPLAWVSAGTSSRERFDEWALRIRLWPEPKPSVVAYADYHGSWIEWAT